MTNEIDTRAGLPMAAKVTIVGAVMFVAGFPLRTVWGVLDVSPALVWALGFLVLNVAILVGLVMTIAGGITALVQQRRWTRSR